MMAEIDGAPVLEFNNLSVSLRGTDVLKNACGIAQPGRLLAVMGPSGAGKTVLLTALAGRHHRGTQTGEVLLRGKTIDKTVRRGVSFILQEDILFDQLTLKETLMYMAQLRLPGDMPLTQIAERVANIVDALGLEKCMNTKIGNYLKRGLSGGERKRTNIACELLTDPDVLLLDEPTSGQDSHTASELVVMLRSYARRYHKVVVMAVHQPSSRTFNHFDDLILMSEGEVVFFGRASGVLDYFSQIDLHCPEHYNPGDFVIDKIKGTVKERRALHEAARLRFQDRTPARDVPGRSVNSYIHTSTDLTEIREENAIAHVNLAFSPDSVDDDPRPSTESAQVLTYVGQHDQGTDPSVAMVSGVRSIPACDPSGTMTYAQRTVQGTNPSIAMVSRPRSTVRAEAVVQHDQSDNPASSPTLTRRICRRSSLFPAPSDHQDDERPKWPTGFWHQLWTLSRRNFTQYRSMILSRVQVLRTLLLGCFIGVFYFQIPHVEERVHDMTGMIFFMLVFWAFEAIFGAIAIFPQERTIIHKERSSGAYRLSSYFFSKILSELPLGVALPFASTAIAYWMTGLNDSPAVFFTFIATILLNNQVSHAIGLFIGAFSTSDQNAIACGSLYGLFSILLGGFYNSVIPAYIGWLRFASVISYSYGACIYVVFVLNPQPIKCSATNTSIFEECQPAGDETQPQSLSVYGNSIMQKEAAIIMPMWGYVCCLSAIMVTFLLLAYLVLRYIRKPS